MMDSQQYHRLENFIQGLQELTEKHQLYLGSAKSIFLSERQGQGDPMCDIVMADDLEYRIKDGKFHGHYRMRLMDGSNEIMESSNIYVKAKRELEKISRHYDVMKDMQTGDSKFVCKYCQKRIKYELPIFHDDDDWKETLALLERHLVARHQKESGVNGVNGLKIDPYRLLVAVKQLNERG